MNDNPVVAIDVQTTRLTGAGVETMPFRTAEQATHWSIYLRRADGRNEWVTDFNIGHGKASDLYGTAVLAAAKLSMQHQVPILLIK